MEDKGEGKLRGEAENELKAKGKLNEEEEKKNEYEERRRKIREKTKG